MYRKLVAVVEDEQRTPRWVKVFGMIALIVIVAFVVLLVAGRGDHGPRRHAASAAYAQR